MYQSRPHTKVIFQNLQSSVVVETYFVFNIAATLVPHEIEYVNEMTMAFVEIVMLKSLLRFETSAASLVGQWVVAGLALAVACLQLGVYNLLGRLDDGDMRGEVPAHYFEFAFEILSSLIAFWFCMDNKNVADEEIGSILYGQHRDCTICSAKSTEFEQMYINSNLKGAMTALAATSKEGAGRLQPSNGISNGDSYGSMVTKMFSV
jgi:hypothetical protein